MEQTSLNNIYVSTWLVDNPRAFVVISHGMAEHVERYDDFATFLNKNGISVYGIHQLGHGRAIKEIKGHFEKDDFFHCADNLNTLINDIKNKNPNKKIFLFGHSMGSFISQYYISTYHNINGVILCGSNAPTFQFKLNKIACNILYCFADRRKPGKLINKIAFGSYNKAFAPNRTESDWLSRNNDEVDKYINDDLCGFTCSVGFFKEFLKGLASLSALQGNIEKSLPIYLISGDKDPVGLFGDGVKKLYEQYKSLEIKDLNITLYEDARHELMNETCKETVKNDVLVWLNKHV